MSKQDKDDLDPITVKKGPGELLQVARIEQNISIDDIARQMNLNAKILHSIEEDDYSDIQSPIFVRGYLRTYARLVGLDEDLMIKLFGDFYRQADPSIKSIGNTTPEISSNDIRVKWMTYAVIIGLVALLSVWWVNNYGSSSFLGEGETTLEKTIANNSDDKTSSDVLTPIGEKTAAGEDAVNGTETVQIPVINSDVKVNLEPISKEIEIEATLPQAETSEIKLSDPVETVVNSTISAIEKNIELTQVEEINEVESLSVATVVEKKFFKDVSAPIGNDVIELNIVADSWGSVRDASNFKLLQDLLKAGNSYRLVGKAPFKVFLGNGYGVEIKLNDQVYDFSKSIKSSNNTARFEIIK